jgi:signal transduction histidine kinase
MFRGTLITLDLIIFIFINAFLFDQVNELSRKTSDENALIKNLLIQQTSLTDAIQKSNKFIVSGALSASIAHELSHPLASIQANTEILTMQLKTKHLLSGDVQNSVTNILRDTQRAGQTLKALKSLFSIKKELFELNINDVMRLSIDLVISTIKKENIQLTLQLENHIPSIMANPQELQQVFLNLLNNAIQAIQKNNPNHGEITIKTMIEGDFIALSILDNGHGFSIDQEGKIFELLRTTKKEGMGFGLWLSKFILEKNFGNIELVNYPGIGAQLNIKLPIYHKSPHSRDNITH